MSLGFDEEGNKAVVDDSGQRAVIEAETRERCAKIADKYQDFGGLSAAIAAEIRDGK